MKRSKIAWTLIIVSVIMMTAGPVVCLVIENMLCLIVSFAASMILLAAGLAAAMKGAEMSIRGSEVEINGPMIDEIIPYDTITFIEFRPEFKYGLKWGGYGGISRIGGGFYNKEFKNYKVAGYTTNPSFILIHHSGRMTAFNTESQEETRMLYEELIKASARASRNSA